MNTGTSSPSDESARLADRIGLARSLVIYRARPWRRRALQRFYRSLVAPGALAFDVGGHVGNRTDALLAVGARCVTIEPQPLFARHLARRYAREPRVRLVTDAVADTTGTARLAVSRRHPTVSTLSRDWIERVGTTAGFEHVRWDREVDVAVTTLDALIDRYGEPDFCKIDVEGMEAAILAGLSRPVPLVTFEYVPAALDIALACIDRLAALGDYVYNRSSGESTQLARPEWCDADAMRRALGEEARDTLSGDVHARLRHPPEDACLVPIDTSPPA